MGFQIEGPSGFIAETSKRKRLQVDSISEERGAIVSEQDQRAFNWNFFDASLAAGTYAGYLLNTSTTRNLKIDLVRVGGVNTIFWKIIVATGTATGGTSVTGENLNLGSGIQSESTALQDNVGGFTAGAVKANGRHVANSSLLIPFDDLLILPPNTAIAFEADAVGGTGIAEVLVRGFYEDL